MTATQPDLTTNSPPRDQASEPAGEEPGEPPSSATFCQPTIDVTTQCPMPCSVDLDRLADGAKRIVDQISRAVVSLSIVLIDDAEMSIQHDAHLGDATTTDILTFDLSESQDSPLEVQLVICVDVAKREADGRGHSIEQELLLYIVHGLLHCCGFDDKSDSDAAVMHAEEDRILTAIGVGNTYDKAPNKMTHGGHT